MSSRRKNRRRPSSIALSVLGVLAIAAFLFPIIWMAITSLQSPEQFRSGEFVFVPSIQNYITVLSRTDFARYYANSIIIALSVVSVGLLIGTPAAYALGRLRFRGREDLAFWILSTRFGPPLMALIPFFLLFRMLGMIDTLPAVIIVHIASFLPFVVWMLRGFFEEIPKEIEEAAMVDGCSRMMAFRKVILALVAPGLSATAILTFIFSWNEFLLALVLTGSQAKTAPVSVYSYMGQAIGGINWGPLTATGVLVTVPVMIFALLVQQNMVRGLTSGAVKG